MMSYFYSQRLKLALIIKITELRVQLKNTTRIRKTLMPITLKSDQDCSALQINNAYYAFLLDNIGPFPVEVTKQLPSRTFNAIWSSFYHYLTLVAETAKPGGGKSLNHYIENYPNTQQLPNLAEITDCLAFDTLDNYTNTQGINYWLNISALLEYGCLYKHLSDMEIEQCQRFEYLQELDHFSEIMDLSLLTKHLTQEFHSLSDLEKEIFIEKYSELFKKYLGLSQAIIKDEALYKPIAGRNKYINLGLERMLGEAAAKRRNCHYASYPNDNLGEFAINFYPIKAGAKVEAQYKILESANVGLTRTKYPYLSLLLTSNAPIPPGQDKLKELSVICSNMILQYGLEIGIAMFDGYVFDSGHSIHQLSILVSQVFKASDDVTPQVKIISVGPCASLVYQNKQAQHIIIRGEEEKGNHLGKTGSKQQRQIMTLADNSSIKIVLAPSPYAPALQSVPFETLKQNATENVKNPLAWLMVAFVKPFKIPTNCRNLLLSHIKPNELEIVKTPKWTQQEIKQIPEFSVLAQQYRNYLQEFDTLEINVLYAHLHADRLVDIHQKISIDIALAFKEELSSNNISFTLQPLIDNLHVRDVFDYKQYCALLQEKNLGPDIILTEDSLLIDRIGQGIIDCFVNQDPRDKYQIVYEGKRAINALFSDGTVVQLIDHMDKEGRLSCVTFDLAQIYYRQAPELFEKLFREDILTNYPDSTLGKWFMEHTTKNYHEIMYDMVYTNPDIQYRNKLFQQITQEIRPNLNKVESAKKMRHYVDALRDTLNQRNHCRNHKVISMYILEGSYDAQFDRYAKVHEAFALPSIDTYRVTFVSGMLELHAMCIKS